MNQVKIRQWPELIPYGEALAAMQKITEERTGVTPDEIWCLEHLPVYTQGMAGKDSHVLAPGEIEVIKADRGGQVTYHGPGQLIVYLLLNLKRKGIYTRQFVSILEQSVIDMLAEYSITAMRREKAPGVYVHSRKIAAIGVRIRKGCCYHGLALNVDMDLLPYTGINPCGYPGLEVTQLKDEGVSMTVAEAGNKLLPLLLGNLDMDEYQCEIITEDRLPGISSVVEA